MLDKIKRFKNTSKYLSPQARQRAQDIRCFLTLNFERLGCEGCAKHLNIQEGTVIRHAKQLGLSDHAGRPAIKRHPATYSNKQHVDILRELGV